MYHCIHPQLLVRDENPLYTYRVIALQWGEETGSSYYRQREKERRVSVRVRAADSRQMCCGGDHEAMTVVAAGDDGAAKEDSSGASWPAGAKKDPTA